jgi:hypothetical protein
VKPLNTPCKNRRDGTAKLDKRNLLLNYAGFSIKATDFLAICLKISHKQGFRKTERNLFWLLWANLLHRVTNSSFYFSERLCSGKSYFFKPDVAAEIDPLSSNILAKN